MNKEYQEKVKKWAIDCFGKQIVNNVHERNKRFIEEALELVQSLGLSRDYCHKLVDYVFDRPSGETEQEVGGVMVTLSCLCSTVGIDVNNAATIELDRILTKVEEIREKQKLKPQ